MDGVGAALADRVEDRLGVQVALGGRLATERVRLVGEADVQRVPVELGVHGDGLDTEFASGTDDSHGDLATVGDQDLLQHGCQCRCRGATEPCSWIRIGRWGRPPVATGLVGEHVAETGSTNTDLLGRGRRGRRRPDGAVHRSPDRRSWSPRSDVGRATGFEPAGLDAVPARCPTIRATSTRRIGLARRRRR